MALLPHQANAVKNGFPWECACGEMYRTREDACLCRKCSKYLEDYAGREDPRDLREVAQDS